MSLSGGFRRLFRIGRYADRVERDVEDELDFHFRETVGDLMRKGMERSEAEREARRRFGDEERYRERIRAVERAHRRRERGAGLVRTMGEDVRAAVRQARRSPRFGLLVVATLALGIGANTTVFSVVDAVLLRPLPYPEPDRLVSVWEVTPSGEDHNPVSPGNYVDWRERTAAFEELGAYGYPFSAGLIGEGRPRQVGMLSVTPSALRIVGARSQVGRTFTPDDETSAERTVLLSDGLWRREFGADSSVVGRTLNFAEIPMTVVGVMPRGFDFPSASVDVWLARGFDAEDREERRSHQFRVIGRLAEGATIERARDELDGVARTIAEVHPEHMEGWGVNVTPYRSDLVGEARPTLLMLLGAVVLVLLAVCANVGILLVARSLGRRREMAIRASLGAGRGRLVRQLLLESGVLAVAGGALGFLAAAGALGVLVDRSPLDVPLVGGAAVDLRVFGFAAAVTLLTPLLFGLVPALGVVGRDLRSDLRGSRQAGGGSPRAARSGLLFIEVALSVMLLVGSGLLVRSLLHLQSRDFGFQPERLLAVSLDLPGSRYQGRSDQSAFYTTLIERLEAHPEVLAAVGTPEPPVAGFNNTFSFEIEGRPRPGPNPRQDPAILAPVTPGYFRALGIPVVRGRAFRPDERAESPAVAVVNETMARRLWPGEDPVGTRIRRGEDQPWIEVVGVVGDTRNAGLEEAVEPMWYIPYEQAPWGWMSWMTLLLRTRTDEPASLAADVERIVWSLDGDLPIHRVVPVRELYAAGLAERRFVTALLSGFGLLTLVLGALGIYGVLSYAVARRAHELGVRMALGATAGRIRAAVLREGLTVTAAGIAAGFVGALLLGRFLSSLLQGVTTRDPVTYAVVSGLLLLVATGACWIPAHRATRVDPRRAMGAE